MFFVLSGLVLWLPIARACARRRVRPPGWVLLLRRMARLLPLYYAVVLVVWALTNPSLPGHWQDLVLHLTFTHVYSDEYIFWTDGPGLVAGGGVPLLRADGARVPFVTPWRGAATAGPALAWPPPCRWPCWSSGSPTSAGRSRWPTVDHTNWSIWFSPLSRAADFGIGMGLAVLAAAGVRLAPGRAGRHGRDRSGALSCWCCTAAARRRRRVVAPGVRRSPSRSRWARIVLHDGPWPALSWKPLAWIGGLGYGIYLIHEPVMRLLGTSGAPGGPARRLLPGHRRRWWPCPRRRWRGSAPAPSSRPAPSCWPASTATAAPGTTTSTSRTLGAVGRLAA